MTLRITADDVRHGVYFMRVPDGSLWRVLTYADRPTATLERVDRRPFPETVSVGGADVPIVPLREAEPERIGGVVGAPIFDDFVRLVPDSDP